MPAEEHSQRRRKPAMWLWVVLALVLVGFTSYRWWAVRQYAKEVEKHELDAPRRRAAVASLTRAMRERIGARRPEIEAEFNNGRPLRPDFQSYGHLAYLDDPNSGWSLRLTFRPDGRLRYCIPYSVFSYPKPSGTWKVFESIRQYTAGYGIILWLIILGEAFIFARSRWLTGQVLLALTILICLAWSCGPYGPLPQRYELFDKTLGIEARGAVYWLVLMAIGSVAVLLWARAGAAASQEPLCLWCHYNLTGNQSGICPECGRPIPKAVRWLIRQKVVDGLAPMPPSPAPDIEVIADDEEAPSDEPDTAEPPPETPASDTASPQNPPPSA